MTEHLAELGPVILVAAAVSCAVGQAFPRIEARLDAFSPEARWRVAFVAAWCPAAAAALFVFGTSLDWGLHGPEDFCEAPGHHASLWMAAVTAAGVGWLAWRAASVAREVFQASRLRRRLAKQSQSGVHFREFFSDQPVAFVVGFLKPQVYVSDSLVRRIGESDLAVVLAHEQYHRSRRDPLRRTLANLGLCFHLPGVVGRIAPVLGETQELAADCAAVEAVGDCLRVAEALVHCGRLRLQWQNGALGFANVSLKKRLHALTHSVRVEAAAARPTRADLLYGLVLALLASAALGHAMHFAWQMILRAV